MNNENWNTIYKHNILQEKEMKQTKNTTTLKSMPIRIL